MVGAAAVAGAGEVGASGCLGGSALEQAASSTRARTFRMRRTVPPAACDQKITVPAVVSVTVETVMRLIFVGLLAGCSFEQGVLPGGGSAPADGSVAVDAPVMIDAVVTPDAPPCDDGDDDRDGVCNGDDDWPCGAKPADPAAIVMFVNNAGATETTITQATLDNTGRFAVGMAQKMMMLRFDYAIEDHACTNACIDQLEIGWVPGGRTACLFDAPVPKRGGASGAAMAQVRAPSAPGVYDLRVNLGQNYSCNHAGASGWWGTTPGPQKTIAKLCVR